MSKMIFNLILVRVCLYLLPSNITEGMYVFYLGRQRCINYLPKAYQLDALIIISIQHNATKLLLKAYVSFEGN